MIRFLLIALLLLPLPAMAATKYFIQYQDQFGKWRDKHTNLVNQIKENQLEDKIDLDWH